MPNSKITEILKYNAADRFYFFFPRFAKKKKKNQFSYFNSKRKTDLHVFHSLKILIHMTAFNLMQRCLKTNSSLLNFFFFASTININSCKLIQFFP